MVFAVNPLRNIGDQVKMMLNLRFSLLQLVPVFPSFHSLLLILLLSPGHVGPVLASDLFKLFFLKLPYFVLVVVDALMNVLLILLYHAFVGLQSVFFKPVTDPQFSLQKFDFLAVVALVIVVPLYPTNNFFAHLFIGLKLIFVLGHELAVHREPRVVTDIIFVRYVLFFHIFDVRGDVRLGLFGDFR